MRKFLGSAAGIIVMTVVFTAIFFGIIIALSNVSEGLGAIVILVCAVNGWRILDRIQPEMFLWMSWVGWLIYFSRKADDCCGNRRICNSVLSGQNRIRIDLRFFWCAIRMPRSKSLADRTICGEYNVP